MPALTTPAAPAPRAETYGLPRGVETFSVRFLATHFGTSHQHWINLIEEGHLAALDLASPSATKSMLRITRAEILRYLDTRKI